MKTKNSVTNCLNQAIQSGLTPIEAEILILNALGLKLANRAWLRVHSDEVLEPLAIELFSQGCQRLTAGEPLAYVVGSQEFYGLHLLVDPRVLDPRPDTETLVDWALQVLQDTDCPRVVDLGTGSGAIALAIKHKRPDAGVLAVDASVDALVVAQNNAARLNLDVKFAQGSWFEPLTQPSTRAEWLRGLELIVSNPPYIAEGDHHLPALKHEPRQALTSGPDGLDDICIIVADAPQHLAPDGWLLLEHGYNQAPAVKALMQERGFADVQSRNDLAGVTRCTGGRWRSAHKAG